jgi:hypothetical protein
LWFARLSAFISTLCAGLFPVLSILALFHIESILKRIYALIGLTVGFALIARILTGAKSIEIFAATAA